MIILHNKNKKSKSNFSKKNNKYILYKKRIYKKRLKYHNYVTIFKEKFNLYRLLLQWKLIDQIKLIMNKN